MKRPSTDRWADCLSDARRHGLLLDTNTLMLLLVSYLDKRLVGHAGMTGDFSAGDAERLEQLAFVSDRLVTTPHVLAEASNFAVRGGDFRPVLREFLSQPASQERWQQAALLAEPPAFLRLGLADMAILDAAKHTQALIVTTDRRLIAQALSEGCRAVDLRWFNES